MTWKDEDFATIQGKRHLLIGARLREARDQLKNLKLAAKIVSDSPERSVVWVQAVWDGGASEGHGLSLTEAEKGPMKRWSLELAETRARHRALAAAGVGPEFYGVEEMDEAEGEMPASMRTPASGAGQVRNGNAVVKAMEAKEKGDHYRKELRSLLLRWSHDNKQTASAALMAIIGKETTSVLDSEEAHRAYVGARILWNYSPDSVAKAMDQAREWFTKCCGGRYDKWECLRGLGAEALAEVEKEVQKRNETPAPEEERKPMAPEGCPF